jgi:hypothetical protein
MLLVALGQADPAACIETIETEARQRSVIMLDGLDEDPQAAADARQRLLELFDLCRGFQRVIVTSRTRAFAAPARIPSALPDRSATDESDQPDAQDGEYQIKTAYLLPLSARQVKRCLKQLYPSFSGGAVPSGAEDHWAGPRARGGPDDAGVHAGPAGRWQA